MKIVSWNLKDIGTGKLAGTLPWFNNRGLGVNVLDYITKVVAADPIWQHVTGANPADVFVVVELVTGGTSKGSASTGSSLTSMTHFVNALNAAVAANPAFHYSAVTPALVTGHNECVGVIYNDLRLAHAGAADMGVLRLAANNRYLLPRTPYWVRFTEVAVPYTPLNIVAVHAPTTTPGTNSYRDPINWCNSLDGVTRISQAGFAAPERTLLVGDFNCGPVVSYTKRVRDAAGNVNDVNTQAFTQLITTCNFRSEIPHLPPQPVPAQIVPAATLTSLRSVVVHANPAPTNYLKEAYDTILYQLGGAGGVASTVWDLIGQARNANSNPVGVALYPADVVLLVQNYWAVSDHLPVAIEY